MIELNAKTLDGKNRTFCVPDDITVKEFKEKIAHSIEIPADTQRLIFQGRVLQDDKKLNEFDVNGKTVHVVARPPPSSQGPSASSSASSSSASQSTGASRDGNTFVLGSFTLPSDPVDPTNIQNIAQQVISGMGEMGRNARVSTRSSGDGSAVDVHIHLGSVGPPEIQSASQLRVDLARRMIQQANRTLDRLDNPQSEEDSRGSSPMDTSETEGATAARTEERSTPEGGSPRQNRRAADAENNNANDRGNNGRPRSPRHPTPAALSELMGEVFTLNQRMQPHLDGYQSNLTDDPTYDNNDAQRDGQRRFNLVSETLHYVSHAYHSISDLMIDMQRPPPREVRAPPSLISQAVHAVPVQAQVNIQGGNAQRSFSATSTNATSTASSSTPRTSTSSTSQMAGGPPITSAPPVASTMFMEFGPNAVTINSVSAHVVPADEVASFTAANTTNTSSSTTRTNSQASAGQNASSMPPPPPWARAGAGGGPPQAIRMQIPVQIPMMAGMPGGMGPMPPQGPGGAGILPPEVMQNIMQMVSSQGFPGFPVPNMAGNIGSPVSSSANTTPSSRSNTTSSSTSSSSATGAFSNPRTSSSAASTQTTASRSSSNSNSRQGSPQSERRAQHAAFVIPGPPLMMSGMGGFGPANGPDPFLPCQSRHFLSDRAQQAANGQPGENGIANMVSNLLSGLMNPGQAQQQQGARPSANSTPTTSASTPSSAAPRPAAASASNQTPAAPGREPDYLTVVRQFMQSQQAGSVGTPSGESTTTSSSTSGTTPGQEAGTTGGEEIFSDLVRGISNAVAQAALGRQTDTIAGFLNNLGDAYNITQSEGVLMDMLNVASQHLTFTDVMSIFYGQPAPLQNLRMPLREMVGQQFLQGEAVSDSSVQRAVERLMDDLTPEIDAACENFQGRDDIDFRATVQEFVRQNLQSAIRSLMNETPSDGDYADFLYALCQNVVHEFIALGAHCLDGGADTLERFIENQVRRISSDVSPMIQQWMVGMPVREMRRVLPELRIPDSTLERYIKRRSDMETSPNSSEGSFMSAESVDETSTTTVSSSNNKDTMEVDSPSSSGAGASNGVSSSESYEELKRKVPPPPSADPRDEAHVRLGSEDWHQAIPPDWVPIISRDVRRQSREAPQGPFSDAYLNGMPAKRRKVMGDKKPETELSDLKTIVPETLRRAVAAAGVEPQSTLQQVTEEASASAPLHNAFEQQICETVRERINQDPDFAPEKFPNADKFFKKGK